MALLENLTYNDVVEYLVSGVKSYCKNVDSYTSDFNNCCKSGWGGFEKEYARGSVGGRYGRAIQRGIMKITIADNSGVAVVTTSTVRIVAQNYLKKVHSTLSHTISQDLLQGVYDAIISFANDNINIAVAACPFFTDDFSKLSYFKYPIFEQDTNIIPTITTHQVITASEMINTLGDFSNTVRKCTHTKIHAVKYNITAWNTAEPW